MHDGHDHGAPLSPSAPEITTTTTAEETCVSAETYRAEVLRLAQAARAAADALEDYAQAHCPCGETDHDPEPEPVEEEPPAEEEPPHEHPTEEQPPHEIPDQPRLPEVRITSVTPGDDSVRVEFEKVEGAADYRVYSLQRPNKVKYTAGGYHKVDYNGVGAAGATLVVEAVDAVGPFMSLSDKTDYSQPHVINGVGPSTNQPNAIARSAPFQVSVAEHPAKSDPTTVFFDDFRDHAPFAEAELPQVYLDANGEPSTYAENYALQNEKWFVHCLATDRGKTYVHNHDSHLMTCVADGPTSPPSPFGRNNYAAMVLTPKVTPTLTADNEIVVGFEVDNHLGGRRWIEISVYDADETLVYPNKTMDWNNLHPTGPNGGQVALWFLNSQKSTVSVYVPNPEDGRRVYQHQTSEWDNFPAAWRAHWDQNQNLGRNAPLDGPYLGLLDLREKFELTISADRIVAREGDFVLEQRLAVPLKAGPKKISITHMVYHTSLEEQENRQYAPVETYWIERANDRDVRHWDSAYVQVRPRG